MPNNQTGILKKDEHVALIEVFSGKDSGFIPTANLMHAWFFCQASTFLNLEKKLEFFYQKTGITGVS